MNIFTIFDTWSGTKELHKPLVVYEQWDRCFHLSCVFSMVMLCIQMVTDVITMVTDVITMVKDVLTMVL